MTKGPLTPPIVLYRILGVTLYDDDSRGSPMTASLEEDRVLKIAERQLRESFSYCRAEGGVGRASCKEVEELEGCFLRWSFELT